MYVIPDRHYAVKMFDLTEAERRIVERSLRQVSKSKRELRQKRKAERKRRREGHRHG